MGKDDDGHRWIQYTWIDWTSMSYFLVLVHATGIAVSPSHLILRWTNRGCSVKVVATNRFRKSLVEVIISDRSSVHYDLGIAFDTY